MNLTENHKNHYNASFLIELVESLHTEVMSAPDSPKRKRLLDVLKLSKEVAETQLKSSGTIDWLLKDRDRKELFMEMYQRDASYYKMLFDKEMMKYDN